MPVVANSLPIQVDEKLPGSASFVGRGSARLDWHTTQSKLAHVQQTDLSSHCLTITQVFKADRQGHTRSTLVVPRWLAGWRDCICLSAQLPPVDQRIHPPTHPHAHTCLHTQQLLPRLSRKHVVTRGPTLGQLSRARTPRHENMSQPLALLIYSTSQVPSRRPLAAARGTWT